MIDQLLNIVTLGIKPLYEKNLSYYKLIVDFKKKLPRPQNEARKITDSEIDSNPFLPESMKYVNAIDVSTHKTSISEQDLDIFMNSIRDFDYCYMLFKTHYKNYSANILRLNPSSNNKDFHLVILQEVLKDDKIHPLKPKDVLIFHLKYKLNPTSKMYKWYLKRKGILK